LRLASENVPTSDQADTREHKGCPLLKCLFAFKNPDCLKNLFGFVGFMGLHQILLPPTCHPQNFLSVKDRENNTTTFSYDANHYLKTINDPRGLQPLRNDYDADGRLVKTTDAFGKEVAYTHDLDNRRETITDRLGNPTIHEYDQNGNVTKTVDAGGGVTTYTYDARQPDEHHERARQDDDLGL